MIINDMGGGGGSSYLYKVTAYSSEGSIPASGAANDIAVVTSMAIPAIDSGGIIWSATQPTVRTNGNALVAGDIWVIDSYTSNVPFVAVNGIYVYAVGCFQWDGSAWRERVAKVYYGEAWVAMYLYLYYLTNQCSSVTGGWASRAWAAQSTATGMSPTVTITAESVTVSLSSQNGKSAVYEILNDIDLTSFSTLKFDGYGNDNGTTQFARLYVVPRASTYFRTSSVASVIPSTAGRAIVSLDISPLNAAYDICIGVWTSGITSPSCTMFSLRLIP